MENLWCMFETDDPFVYSHSSIILTLAPDSASIRDQLERIDGLVRSVANKSLCLSWSTSKFLLRRPSSMVIACKWMKRDEGTGEADIIQSIIASLNGISASVSIPATLHCPIPMRTHQNGDTEFDVRSQDILSETARSCFLDNGLIVLRDAIDSSRCDALYESVLQRIAAVECAMRSRGVEVETEPRNFAEIGFRGLYRHDLLIKLEDDALISSLALDGPWIPFIASLLDQWEVEVSVVYSRNGAEDQYWHSDGAHLNNNQCANPFNQFSPLYALCVFMPLINLNREVGFTQFWPGSHAHPLLLNIAPHCLETESQFDGLIRRGECLLYDYRLVHRGMKNVCAITPIRPVLQFFYHLPAYKERANYGTESLFSPV